MITWDQVMMAQLAAQIFVLVDLKLIFLNQVCPNVHIGFAHTIQQLKSNSTKKCPNSTNLEHQ